MLLVFNKSTLILGIVLVLVFRCFLNKKDRLGKSTKNGRLKNYSTVVDMYLSNNISLSLLKVLPHLYFYEYSPYFAYCLFLNTITTPAMRKCSYHLT